MLLIPGLSFAQVQSSDVVLNLNPTYPRPGESVTAILSSFSTDLNKANISWSVNSQQKATGVGQKKFSFNTGDLTSVLNLEAHINTTNGEDIYKRMRINPAEVDMLVQSNDSFVPPFYRGRSFVASEGTFRVVAMPSIMTSTGLANPNALSYSWKADDSPLASASGFGKNALTIKNTYLDNGNTAEVKVSDVTGNTNAVGKINLTTILPKIIFYKNNPSLGLDFSQGIDTTVDLGNQALTLVAEPYFFSPKNINSKDLDFSWSINGDKINVPGQKNVLSVSPANGQTGSANISLTVNNVKTLFQTITKNINASF